jgi:CoB--CoM heterodisulfide reductase subunit B
LREYALYPGCVASVREIGYELSVRNVFEALGFELRRVEDFNCCMPACLVHSIDYTRGLALTSRNLCVAEDEGLPLLTLCSSCFGNLSRARYMLEEYPDIRREVNDILGEAGRRYRGEVEVEHVVTVLYKDITLERLGERVDLPLKGVRAAPFYGCHIFLPHRYAGFDDPEFPQKLEDLITVTGAENVDYSEKTSCCIGCGSFFGEVSEGASVLLAEMILDSAKERGADCVVTTCPFCIMQLELGQLRLREKGKDHRLPVIHYVDLLGLSMGMEPEDLGLDLRRLDMEPLLEKIRR